MDEKISLTIEQLRQLHNRLGLKDLKVDDYAVCGALVLQRIKRYEDRRDRLIRKAKEAAAANTNIDDRAAPAPGTTAPSPDAAVTGDSAHSETPNPEQATTNDDAPAPQDSDPVAEDNDAELGDGSQPGKKGAPGHGRNGAAAYTNADHFTHPLPDGVIGSPCQCGSGPIHNHRPTTTIHIIGQPLFAAESHHYAQGRCRICGNVVTAKGPDYVQQGFGKSVVYGYSAAAMLIVMHYTGTTPFKRLESLHESWGIPFADANQWEVVNQSDGLLRPLFDALERVGMQDATSLSIDDTGSMIISISRQIKAEIAALQQLGESTSDVRTGINATGIRLETPHGLAILFATGLHHAGEVLDRLMKLRQAGSDPLVKVTDAASKNFSHDYTEDALIEAVCHAHAFLKFQGIKAQHPNEYAVAGEVYKRIFDHDNVAAKRKLTPKARMDYHAEHSRPLLERLHAMCVELIESKRVEPSSKLWEPVNFIINQWSRLTKFYEKPGVPLHTNLVEQIPITPVRYLAGSFNYKTAHGACVGDRHMSLICRARANGVEPVAYLEHCLLNHADLANRPEYYLPWAYRDRLQEQMQLADPSGSCPPTKPAAAEPDRRLRAARRGQPAA